MRYDMVAPAQQTKRKFGEFDARLEQQVGNSPALLTEGGFLEA
jgi:hypothetical protein